MKTIELQKLLEANDLKEADFYKWMDGQTVSFYEGTQETNWYECDVERFIRGRGNLKTLD